ncbi:MAG: FtsX-like permease family protein [Terriglobales bacterium]
MRAVMPDYFKTLGIAQLEGRDFTPSDSPDAAPVAIVSDDLARRYFPGESAMGKRISVDMGDGKNEWREIVGIVGSVRQANLEKSPEAQLYLPFDQFSMPMAAFVVRTRRDSAGFLGELRQEIINTDRYQSAVQPREMIEVFRRSVQSRKFNMLLLGIFAAAAVLLTALGIYGVVSFVVAQSTGEIGIRLALGARTSDVMWLILRRGTALLAIGIVFGVAISLVFMNIVASMLFQVTAHDSVVLISATALVTFLGYLAMYFPARKATRVDPLMALRSY